MVATRLGAVCLISAMVAGTAVAQTQAPFEMGPGEPHAHLKDGKSDAAHRITGERPRIDGRLDDIAWNESSAVEDHLQTEPDNLAAPTERTVVKIAFDDRYLYVAAYCYTRDPSTIRRGLGRRGSIPSSDLFTIGIDPQHDHRTSYVFQTNPSGVQNDFSIADDARIDNEYEAVWEVMTSTTDEGWFAEFRIPFSQMRFAVRPGQRVVFGVNWRRDVRYRGEWIDWIRLPRGTQGLVSVSGHVVLDDRVSTVQRREVLPFVLAKRETRTGVSSDTTGSAGIDARIGIGTVATVSATVNPDFGQVEADPAVLNLTVFETFFPEKRPFFTEDSRIFSISAYSGMNGFYSRRIGQAPGRLALRPGDRLVSRPDETTILGAAKVSGKKSLWNFGGLTALTSEEHAIVDATVMDAAGQATVTRVERLIEPRTLYSVGRIQREVMRGSSSIGAIGTAVVRDGDLDAYTGGGDVNLRWKRNRYNVTSHWLGTRAPIGPAVRNGVGGEANFFYTGKYLGVTGHYDHFGANFRNTDLGFLTQRTNKNEVRGRLSLSRPDPHAIFRGMLGIVEVTRQWNADGLTFGNSIFAAYQMSFLNFSNLTLFITRDLERLDDLDTRGGPPIVKPSDWIGTVSYFSDFRKRWGYGMQATGITDAEGGDSLFFAPSFRIQPSARLQATVRADYTTARDIAQWIRNVDADRDGAVDHVYGRLRRNVLGLTMRGTFAFTRDMTLEAYLQPFAAVGDYTDIRKLARPRSLDFTPVTLADNPDFNRKSLRGTMVLRWEYVRGSTLYAVWNFANSDTSRPGVFAPWRDLGGGFGAPGTNVFAIKVSYWLAL